MKKEAVSPLAGGPLGQQVAGLMGINEVGAIIIWGKGININCDFFLYVCDCVCEQTVLEAQMKVEQQSTEGMAGILVSIDESGPTGIHYI